MDLPKLAQMIPQAIEARKERTEASPVAQKHFQPFFSLFLCSLGGKSSFPTINQNLGIDWRYPHILGFQIYAFEFEIFWFNG